MNCPVVLTTRVWGGTGVVVCFSWTLFSTPLDPGVQRESWYSVVIMKGFGGVEEGGQRFFQTR